MALPLPPVRYRLQSSSNKQTNEKKPYSVTADTDARRLKATKVIVKVELYTESKGKYRQKALSYGKGPPKTKVIVNNKCRKCRKYNCQ